MTFNISSSNFDNDDFELDEDSSGDLVLTHKDSGATFKYDSSESVWIPSGGLGSANNPVSSIHSDSVNAVREWNDVIIAQPGERTVQQALNDVNSGGWIFVRGSHDENDIQIPNKSFYIKFIGDAEVVNNDTTGNHTFKFPDTTSALHQIWLYPRVEGNASSGEGFHSPSGDNKPNNIGIINPRIVNHGGHGFHAEGPVGLRIFGYAGAAQIENNGQNVSPGANIYIGPSSTSSYIEGINFGGSVDRDIWWENANGSGVGRNVHNVTGNYGVYLEDAYNFTIQGPYWFESSGTADLYWEGGVTRGGLVGRPSRQVGSVHWDVGAEIANEKAAISFDSFTAGPNTTGDQITKAPQGKFNSNWGTTTVGSGGSTTLNTNLDQPVYVVWNITNPGDCGGAIIDCKREVAFDGHRVRFEEQSGNSFTADPQIRYKYYTQ